MIPALIIASLLIGAALLVYRDPELLMDLLSSMSVESVMDVYDWLSVHYGQIASLACIAGMFHAAFIRRSPLKFTLFAGSLIITQVLKW